MSAIAEAIQLAKAGRRKAASDMLIEEFAKLQTPDRLVDLCEYIATCFEQLEDYFEAGNWYETAGKLVLCDGGSLLALRAPKAIDDYEDALRCYSRCENEEDAMRCTEVMRELQRSCACS